ncbi:class I SAM-dependent methyltransferase [Chitinimonas sp. BJB300]|uniref:class I SAM-dependent methyltransferase n=1 Tax=Chitinimonas sp. BJB300 TaxID=1559339 RepID=UPI000C10CD3F|nr:class I SAM-dependent methyltransferase [Chitinimonas sp. BJB300]PHV10201.1 hypothetical protein CSQ89_17460 [Chitinimonas sp. BJB300]TSJ83031.1 class I SAM-dependent methyltransferase [Chitinimonas sp. BJB300]
MYKFNICNISINAFNKIFEDLILALKGSFIDLGYSCTVSTNEVKKDAVNILIGSTIFASRYNSLVDKIGSHPFIVYQLEQLDEALGLLPEWLEYLDLLDKASWIFDYSPANLPFYKRKNWNNKVSIVEPGFHRCLERFKPLPNAEIDVLYYGSPHPRREKIVNKLIEAGLCVNYQNYVVGEDLVQLIRRSKIVLNIHAWDVLSHLETVRISYLLSNRCLVVSENSSHDPYDGGVVFCDYDNLVERCIQLISADEGVRSTIAQNGYLAIRKNDFSEKLADLIREIHTVFDNKIVNTTTISLGSTTSGYSYRNRPEIVNLVPIKAKVILDVGCSGGMIGASIKKRQESQITGIERNVMAAMEAAKALDFVLCGDFFELLPDLPVNHYDAIILADVLEHVLDTQGLLFLLRERLAADGALILSVPNVRHWSLIKHLLEGGWDYQDEGLLDRDHKRFFTARTLVQDLDKAGFVVVADSATVTQDWKPSQQLLDALEVEGIVPTDGLLGCAVFQYHLVCKKKDG